MPVNRELPTIPFDEFARQVRRVFDELARTGQAILVERDGVVYRLEPQPPTLQTADPHGIWANYDPEEVATALRQARGVLTGVDREELLRDLREQREQDSTGRPAA